MTKREKESNDKIKNIESSISSESISKSITKIKFRDFFNVKTEKKPIEFNITNNEYYFLFWN